MSYINYIKYLKMLTMIVLCVIKRLNKGFKTENKIYNLAKFFQFLILKQNK